MPKSPYATLRPPIRRPYTEVYLIRHCNPDYSLEKKIGQYDMPLSKFGKEQRKFLTKSFLGVEIDRVYTSGLRRAQETAEVYLKKTGKKMIVDTRLDEIDWKHWHRVKYFNMSEKTREKKLKHHARLDKELDEMQSKARRLLADIFRHNYGKKIALFSHGNFIKAMLTGILNADIIGFLSLEIMQSSVSKLVIDRDGYIKISFINNISHLPIPPAEDLFITLVD